MAVTDAGLGTAWNFSQGFASTLMTDFYQPWINDAKNNASVLLGMVPETSDQINGKFVIEPVKFGRNVDAFGFVRDNGKLPDPGSAKARPYAYRVRQMFARAKISGRIMRASQSNPVAYVDALDDVMQQMADDMAVELNRILHSDGSGRIAELSAVTGGGLTTGQVDLRLNQNIESVASCTSSPAQFLKDDYISRRVAIVAPDGTVRGIRRVIAVVSETVGPPSAARVTTGDPITGAAVALPAGTAIGDWIVTAARNTADGGGQAESINTGFKNEPMGIAGIFADTGVLDGHGIATAPSYTVNGGTMSYTPNDDYDETNVAAAGFQGIPVDSTHPWNRSIVMDGAGVLRVPTEELLQLVMDRLEEENNAECEVLLSGFGERSAYGETLTPDKRYNNTTTLSGGWTGLDFKGKTWVVDRHCLKNRIYFLGLRGGGFRQHVETTFQALDPLGPMWYRLQDDDEYHAAWVAGMNFGVGIRNKCGAVVTDIRRST